MIGVQKNCMHCSNLRSRLKERGIGSRSRSYDLRPDLQKQSAEGCEKQEAKKRPEDKKGSKGVAGARHVNADGRIVRIVKMRVPGCVRARGK